MNRFRCGTDRIDRACPAKRIAVGRIQQLENDFFAVVGADAKVNAFKTAYIDGLLAGRADKGNSFFVVMAYLTSDINDLTLVINGKNGIFGLDGITAAGAVNERHGDGHI